jgi:ABC-type dipeptide/oligopeptide/nickel transport system permease subunit
LLILRRITQNFNKGMAASIDNQSFQQEAWKRLKRNKGALFGLVVIVLAIFVAVFAYWLMPDGTTNANRMQLEIQGRQPGYQQQFVLLKKDKGIDNSGFFDRLFNGRSDAMQWMPIQSYQIKNDSIIVNQYVDEDTSVQMALANSQLFAANTNDNFVQRRFLLGTDKFGRDLWSRIILGTRVSLSVGIITVIISLSIGVVLGALAGYFKGRTDDVIMWLINVIWSIPTLLLVFAITLLLGKGFWQVFVAVGLTMWVNVARLVRGQVLAVRELEYVEATKALGFSHWRSIFKHILPNIFGPVLVIAASNFASAIVIEAGLSFLGVGVQPPQPSWGLMIKENYNFIITNNPMLALAPGFAIMLLVLAFNLLGNGLRDALNVKAKI